MDQMDSIAIHCLCEKKSAGLRLWKSFARESNPERLISSQIADHEHNEVST